MNYKKIFLPLLLGASLLSICGCTDGIMREPIKLTLDNYLEYFDAIPQESNNVTFYNNIFIAPAYASTETANPVVNAMFSLKKNRFFGCFTDVKFTFKVNYYLENASIEDKTKTVVTYTSNLQTVFVGDVVGDETIESYYIGVTLSYDELTSYDGSTKEQRRKYQFPTLASHFKETNNESCSYIREIKISNISGMVNLGID